MAGLFSRRRRRWPADEPMLGDPVFVLALAAHAVVDQVEGSDGFDRLGIRAGTAWTVLRVGEHVYTLTIKRGEP